MMQRTVLPTAVAEGYITRYSLDMLDKIFSITVETLRAGVAAQYEIAFLGLTRFALTDNAHASWERLELTEVTIDHGPESSNDEEWEVRLNFWDVAELDIHCRTILVDGVALL